MRFHFELAVRLRPIFKGKVERSRSQIASADADLTHRRIRLAFFIYEFSRMHSLGEVRDRLLLCGIKIALVYASVEYVFTEPAPRQMMEHHAPFSRVDDFSVVERGKLFE